MTIDEIIFIVFLCVVVGIVLWDMHKNGVSKENEPRE